MVAFLRVQQGRKVERGIGFFFQKYACGIKESAEVTPLCCACYVGTLKHLCAMR